MFLVFCRPFKENYGFKVKNAKFGRMLRKQPSKEEGLSA
jgi:hypothetical protein